MGNPPFIACCVFLLITTTLLHGALSAGCEEYRGSFCSEIVSQYPAGIYVGAAPQEALEQYLEASFINNFTMIMVYYPHCRFDTLRHYCTQFFPPCEATNTYPLRPCQDVCTAFESSCSAFFPVFPTLTPNCSLFPSEACLSANQTPYALPNENVCQLPLVPNPHPGRVTKNCPGGLCCFQCPNAENFYKDGDYQAHQLAFNIITVIGGLGALFVFISHLAIPTKRVMTQITIISISAALFIGTIPSWIVIIAGPTASLCDTPVTPASPGTENALCLAQGSLRVFGLLASSYWFLCLALNIHLIVFWKLAITPLILALYHVISWGGPLIAVILVNALDLIAYEGGMTCNVRSSLIVETTIIPVAIAVFGSLLLNFITFGRVTYVAIMLKSKIRSVLALQFRPMLYSILTTLSLIISCAFFAISESRRTDLSWASSWFVCLALGNGQDQCAVITVPHVLELYRYTISAVFAFLVYIFTFVFFGLKRDVLAGWKEIFTSQPPEESPTSSKHGSDKTVPIEIRERSASLELAAVGDLEV